MGINADSISITSHNKSSLFNETLDRVDNESGLHDGVSLSEENKANKRTCYGQDSYEVPLSSSFIEDLGGKDTNTYDTFYYQLIDAD